jgi:hypothetical protein
LQQQASRRENKLSLTLTSLDDSTTHCIVDFFKRKNDLELNSIILAGAQDLAQLGKVCKRLHTLARPGLEKLRNQYQKNVEDLKTVKYSSKILRPLHDCILKGDLRAFLVRLRNGCDVNEKDKCKRTALHLAARLNKIDFVEQLIAHPGLDNSIKTRQGNDVVKLTANEKIRDLIN